MSKTSAKVKGKYNNKTYNRVVLFVRKENTQALKDLCASKGETVSGYIKRLIKQDSGVEL